MRMGRKVPEKGLRSGSRGIPVRDEWSPVRSYIATSIALRVQSEYVNVQARPLVRLSCG